jgi:perosamine synthetase|tara:strand:- start:902 stop:2011 length:1110 start_codon:yes stop_codon:yes gene_type:complete
MKIIKLRKPYFPKKNIQKIQKKISEALRNGQLTLGKNVDIFEKGFSRYTKSRFGSGVSSATAGLHISLLSLGIKQNDEVIVPAKTFISTANAAVYCNAKPIFCDVQEDTFQMDPEQIRKLITKKTKAIIAVHLGGNVCDMKQMLEVSDKFNIPIIEDASHAHGATYNKKQAGTFGKIGVFSFYPDKVMGSADGGIVITNNSEIHEKILELRNVGRKKLGEYDYNIIGYNYRMNELQAILLNEQLRLLPTILRKRRHIAKIYDDELENIQNLFKQKIDRTVNSSYYAYILRLSDIDLDKIQKKLYKKGIETSPMFTTIYKMKAYQKIVPRIGACKISEKLDNQTFTIPLHPGLTENDVLRVIREIKKSFN